MNSWIGAMDSAIGRADRRAAARIEARIAGGSGLGETLLVPLSGLADWVVKHQAEIAATRQSH